MRTVHEGLQRAGHNVLRPKDVCPPPRSHWKACVGRKLCSERSIMPQQPLTPRERSTTFIVMIKWHRNEDGQDGQDGQGGHAALPCFTKRVSATDGVRNTDAEGLLSAGHSSYRHLWVCWAEINDLEIQGLVTRNEKRD